MKIFDFTTNRRSYLISKCKGEDVDYNFYFYSGRKEYLTENIRDLSDVKKFCPEILGNKIDIEDLDSMADSDVIITTSASMLFKEYEKRAFDFLNNFKGKLVTVDYAWEAPNKAHDRQKNGFKRDIDAIAVVGDVSKYPFPFLSYSQPEIDILAHVDKFITKEEVIRKYNLPDAEKYILVTSHHKFETAHNFIKKMREYNNVHFIWKIKEKVSKNAKLVLDLLRKYGISNVTIVVSPPVKEDYQIGKSHTDFLSPVAEMSRIIDCHLNLPPVSYSHMEMIRAGIPTYGFDGNNFTKPKGTKGMVDRIFDTVWTEESLKNCYSGDLCIDRNKCEVKVDEFFFTKNFLKNLRKLINV